MDYATCPTLEETTEAILKELPRGRAWQNNEGLPARAMQSSFNPDAFNPDYFATVEQAGTYLWQYWRSFAVMMDYFYQRLCALRREFWCHSINETRDSWMIEYGLPDECDPFPDLCTKVAALGGTRCDYYAEVAARAGWSVSCEEAVVNCGSRMGCNTRMGKARMGSTLGRATVKIIVQLDQSPAYEPTGRYLPPLMGRMRMGRRFTCGPSLLPLQCLLSRVIHAEIFTIYEVRYGN